jgi:hypothetical protein
MHICKKILCIYARKYSKYAKYADYSQNMQNMHSAYLAADSESALMTPGPAAAAAAACQGRTKSFWPIFGQHTSSFNFFFVSKVIFAGPLPPAGGSATRAKTQAGKNSATCDSDHRHVTAESDSHGDTVTDSPDPAGAGPAVATVCDRRSRSGGQSSLSRPQPGSVLVSRARAPAHRPGLQVEHGSSTSPATAAAACPPGLALIPRLLAPASRRG